MKGIYAIYDNANDTILDETLTTTTDYRQVEAAYTNMVNTPNNIFNAYPADFKIIKVGEVNGRTIHIYEDYQIMRQLKELVKNTGVN